MNIQRRGSLKDGVVRTEKNLRQESLPNISGLDFTIPFFKIHERWRPFIFIWPLKLKRIGV